MRRPGERLAVAELSDRYVAYLEAAGRKPSTIAAVRGHIAHWLKPLLGDRQVDAVRREDVRDLVSLMRAGGARQPAPREAAVAHLIASTAEQGFGVSPVEAGTSAEAGYGNRTRLSSLGSSRSTDELIPRMERRSLAARMGSDEASRSHRHRRARRAAGRRF